MHVHQTERVFNGAQGGPLALAAPLPTSNCPRHPAELPNDFTYTSLICLARVAASVWRLSLHMPFTASYPVKFNCTAPTVAREGGGSPPSRSHTHTLFATSHICKYKHQQFNASHHIFSILSHSNVAFSCLSPVKLNFFSLQRFEDGLWTRWSFKLESLDVWGCPQVFCR